MKKICSFESCDKAVLAQGLCSGHHNQRRQGKTLTPLRKIAKKGAWKGKVCSVDGCDRPVRNRDLCATHYKNGSSHKITKTIRPGEWGGWVVAKSGYVVRTRRVDGRVQWQYEHRYIMEQVIGRPLQQGENVHHINGVKADNRPENLELWSTRQPSGQRVEDKLAYAWEMIRLYGNSPFTTG